MPCLRVPASAQPRHRPRFFLAAPAGVALARGTTADGCGIAAACRPTMATRRRRQEPLAADGPADRDSEIVQHDGYTPYGED
jgi:hypothetical protein